MSVDLKTKDQEVTKPSAKGQVMNILGSVGHAISSALFDSASIAQSHRQYINKWGHLCSNITLFTKNRQQIRLSSWQYDLNLDEMDKFLERHKVLKLTQERQTA